MANGFDWKGLVGSVAPLIAGTFGTPFAGMAVKALCDAVGLTGADATEDKLSDALQNASLDLLAKLRQADEDFDKRMASVGVNLEELAVKDRDSARQMQVQTRAKTPAVLSYMVVLMTLTLYTYLIVSDETNRTLSDIILGRILGTFDMAFGVVLAYWLGAAHREVANRKTGTA